MFSFIFQKAGRSALFMAASVDNYIGTKLLLYYRADPNVVTDGKRGVLDYAASLRIKALIETAKRARISMDMAPRSKRHQIWKTFGKISWE